MTYPCCFPHPSEREVIGRAPNWTASWQHQLLLAWRRGYLDAFDPAASEYEGGAPGCIGPNHGRGLTFEYQQGFRCRRLEMRGEAMRRWDINPRVLTPAVRT